MKINDLFRGLLLLVAGSVASVVSAATVEVDGVDGIYYYIYYDSASVTSNPDNYFGDIVIPETIQVDGKTYTVTSISDSAFEDCSGLTSIKLPEGLTTIGNSAFRDCSGLTSIDIPAGVIKIYYDAFLGCSGLKAVNISDLSAWCRMDFDTLYSNPLYYAHNLYLNGELVTDLTIPADITEIKNYAFRGCSSLTSVRLPESLATIGYSAFEYCSGLTSIDIPDGVTTIEQSTFSDCSGLTSIELPVGLTTIGDSAFSGCSGLTSIDIPDGVTSIGVAAFEHCHKLASIELPIALTEILEVVFDYCNSLREIVSKNPVPPVALESTFEDMHYRNSILRVPQEAVDDYRNADVWCNFRNMIGMVGGVDDVDDDAVTVAVVGGDIVVGGLPSGTEVEVYSLAGQLVHSGTDTTVSGLDGGIYIVRVAGQTFKVVL